MKHTNVTPTLSERRRFISTMATTLAAACTPLAANSANPAPANELHTAVANHAKQLATKNGRHQLKILIPEGCSANLAPVISAFQLATGVTVESVETELDDINTQLILDSLSNSGDYDLALPATFGIPDLVAAKAIIPISDYAKKYEPAGFRQDILYGTGDTFDEELYGFQTDGDTYVMFYNRTLLDDPDEQARYLDRYGVSLAIPLTWQQLDQQMEFFHRPAQGLSGGLLFRTAGYLAWEWWVRFHAKGYWPLSESLDPQINADAGIEALEEMINATRHLAPETMSLGLFANWERFSHGDVYCNIGWGGTQKYLNGPKSSMRGKIAYGPTPGGMVNDELLLTPYFNWGWNYVVASRTPLPELAYLFSLYASTPTMSTVAVRQQGGYFDPYRPEHYQDAQIIDIYSTEFLKVHEQSLKSSIPDLYIAKQGQYSHALSTWLERAITGVVSAKEALNRVNQSWTILNERSDKTLQSQRWMRLRDKYPAGVRRRLKDL